MIRLVAAAAVDPVEEDVEGEVAKLGGRLSSRIPRHNTNNKTPPRHERGSIPADSKRQRGASLPDIHEGVP